MTRAVVVIDGEHYAPVVRDAIAGLPYDVVGAWLAGGTEKLRGVAAYGVPLQEIRQDGFGDGDGGVGTYGKPVPGGGGQARRAGARAAGPVSAGEPRARGRGAVRGSGLPLRSAGVRGVRA